MPHPLRLLPAARSLAVSLGYPSFSRDRAIQWRYRRAESDWIAGGDQPLMVSGLAAGRQSISIQALSEDARVLASAVLEVDVEPTFLETSFGRLLVFGTATLLFALSAWTVGRWRTHRLEIERARLERVVVARTAELARAHGETERLLLNILPAPIIDRLQAGESPIADAIEEVSVVFADLVGFTPLASSMPPAALVKLLDDIFRHLDGIADTHGMEKVKTIGDSYFAVAGVPVPRRDHAQSAARFALAIREYMHQLREQTGLELSMRIGISSGPVVAGVIGLHKFSYDLWGDTVNAASRMESHGEPGNVHISDTTAALLGSAFVLEARGQIAVKGKGRMQTWWLLGEAAQDRSMT